MNGFAASHASRLTAGLGGSGGWGNGSGDVLGRFPSGYQSVGSSSFTDFLGTAAPHLLPGRRFADQVAYQACAQQLPVPPVPHGTTIVSLAYAGGVLLAGDRRATMGNIIASRDIEKIFVTDDHSAAGIAGVAGVAVEMIKLFQVELEHFEKLEGAVLSLEGKANRLAAMIRGNLGLAMQGLSVVPIFVGYDLDCDCGRMFSYDVTGGCYEERDHHSVGSGAVFARGALKKLWRPDMELSAAVRVAIEALYDAADDDTATGGPDLGRRIFPTCAAVDVAGARLLAQDDLAALAATVVADRRDNPGGSL